MDSSTIPRQEVGNYTKNAVWIPSSITLIPSSESINKLASSQVMPKITKFAALGAAMLVQYQTSISRTTVSGEYTTFPSIPLTCTAFG